VEKGNKKKEDKPAFFRLLTNFAKKSAGTFVNLVTFLAAYTLQTSNPKHWFTTSFRGLKCRPPGLRCSECVQTYYYTALLGSREVEKHQTTTTTTAAKTPLNHVAVPAALL